MNFKLFYFPIFLVAIETVLIYLPCATNVPLEVKSGQEGASRLMIAISIICIMIGALDHLTFYINPVIASMAMLTGNMWFTFMLAGIVYFLFELLEHQKYRPAF